MINNKNSIKLQLQEIKSLKDIAYDAISFGILTGEIKVGTRLIESELSRQLGISRGPIREALNVLEQDGFIQSVPYKGAIVAEISQQETEDVFIPIRKFIENYAFTRAHKILDEKDYSKLGEIIKNIGVAYNNQNYQLATKYDFEFHKYIINKCTSPTLNSIWHSLSARITRKIYLQTMDSEIAHNIVEQHKNILDCIRNNKVNCLKILLETHFD